MRKVRNRDRGGGFLTAAVTYFVFRTGLGAVCLLAGVEKARAPRELLEGVRQYGLVPARLAPFAGWALIAAELVLGIVLLLGTVWLATHLAVRIFRKQEATPTGGPLG